MAFKKYQKFTSEKAAATANKNSEANTVAVKDYESSKLDLSYSHKTTFNVGELIAVGYWECLPKDVFEIDTSILLKMSIPSAATMDNPRYDLNFFFIPWNQVWKNWNNLIGTSYESGAPVTPETVPNLNWSSLNLSSITYKENDIAAYFNLPININMSGWNVGINVLPFRAYVKVWNDWYRDENLDAIADFSNNENPDSGTPDSYNSSGSALKNAQYGKGTLKVNRLRDYFSSCLPFIQKGEAANISSINMSEILNNTTVDIPNLIVTNNPDTTNTNTWFNPNWMSNNININTGAITTGGSIGGGIYQGNTYAPETSGTVGSEELFLALQTQANSGGAKLNYNGTGNTTFNITDLRTALVKQHQQELDARAGTRYVEKLASYWGITLNPLEIGRTELIGGWHSQIQINNIVQTAPSTSEAPNSTIGMVKGLSITTGNLPKKIKYSCDQYGIILACICVRTNLSYSQGIPKLFTKINNWDYYNPTFNGISEQPIYQYELYANASTDFTAIFGYNQPFADLKYKVNVASGYLSTNATDTYYNFYTYQDNLNAAPTLSNTWMYYPASALEDTLLLDASNKNENINDFIADIYFNVSVDRVIPAYSIPGVDKI